MTDTIQKPDGESKDVWFCGEMLVEQADALCFKPGDTVTFVNWGNMKVAEVRKDEQSGEVTVVEVDLDLDNKAGQRGKSFPNFKFVTLGLQKDNEGHLAGQPDPIEEFHGQNCALRPFDQQADCGQRRGLEAVCQPGECGRRENGEFANANLFI